MRQQFLCSTALAGGGKTFATMRVADQWAKEGKKVLILQPSKALIKSTATNELPKNPPYKVTVIHSDEVEEVVRTLRKHFQNAKRGEGEVLMGCQQAFSLIPYIQNKRDWIVIVDEPPEINRVIPLNIPDSHKILTDQLKITATGLEYGLLSMNGDSGELPDAVLGKSIKSIAINKNGDDVLGYFREAAHLITSPHWEVYVRLEEYYAVTQYRKKKQLTLHALMKPSMFEGFEKVIMVGALFEESTMFKHWSSYNGIEFKESNELSRHLRYRKHSNGKFLTIKYLFDEPWSKSRRDKKIKWEGTDLAVKDAIPKMVKNCWEDVDFVWMGNTDLPDNYFGDLKAIRLPNTPHGLNQYMKLNNVIVVSALNPPPSHFKFMRWKGFDGDELRTALYRRAVYQAIMRTSLRDPDSVTQKNVIVMDRDTAEWLSALFPESRVEAIFPGEFVISSNPPHRPRKHATEADRKAAHKQKIKAQGQEMRLLIDQCRSLNVRLSIRPDGIEPTVSDIFGPRQQERAFGSVFASIFEKEAACKIMALSDEEFCRFLDECYHKNKVAKKEGNFLISPAIFDPNVVGGETFRGEENTIFCRGVWLDNDGEGISAEEFARLFPTLKMIIWNTYSSTGENLRWRCYISTNEALTAKTYGLIIKQIMHSLRASGYGSKNEKGLKPHGFDESKFAGHSLFYAPCKAKDKTGNLYLRPKGRDRKPLDVYEMIRNFYPDDFLPPPMYEPAVQIETATETSEIAQTTQNLIPFDKSSKRDRAIQRFRSSPDGTGHNASVRLALDLNKAGMTNAEVRQEMYAQAATSRNPKERTKEVRGIIKWAKRVCRRA
mgnify:CR=1 FL=1|jgi:hypothetical protein